MKMPLYTIWGDSLFYAYAAGFAASMFSLIYSISRWVELKNEARYNDDLPPLPADLAAEMPAPAPEAGADTSRAASALQDAQAWEQALAGDEPPAAAAAPGAAEQAAEKTVVVPNIEELVAQTAQAQAAAPELPAEEVPAPAIAGQAGIDLPPEEAAPQPATSALPRQGAEEYVRGIYERLAGMDARLSAIEGSVATGEDSHFAVKFLEGVLEDFDALSKEKIRARVNYLIADLKENQQRGAKL